MKTLVTILFLSVALINTHAEANQCSVFYSVSKSEVRLPEQDLLKTIAMQIKQIMADDSFDISDALSEHGIQNRLRDARRSIPDFDRKLKEALQSLRHVKIEATRKLAPSPINRPLVTVKKEKGFEAVEDLWPLIDHHLFDSQLMSDETLNVSVKGVYNKFLKRNPLTDRYELVTEFLRPENSHKYTNFIELADGRLFALSHATVGYCVVEDYFHIIDAKDLNPQKQYQATYTLRHDTTVDKDTGIQNVYPLKTGQVVLTMTYGKIAIYTPAGPNRREHYTGNIPGVASQGGSSVWASQVLPLSNGDFLVGGSDGSIVRFEYNPQTMGFKMREALTGHTKFITSMIELHDGRVATAAHDGTVRIWPRLDDQRTFNGQSLNPIILSPTFEFNAGSLAQLTDSKRLLVAMTNPKKNGGSAHDAHIQIFNYDKGNLIPGEKIPVPLAYQLGGIHVQALPKDEFLVSGGASKNSYVKRFKMAYEDVPVDVNLQ